MTATPSILTTVPFNSPDSNPTDRPTYVSSRALAANAAESITIPAGGAIVRLAATADVYYNFTVAGALVAAVVPVDTDDGSSNELLKQQGDAVWRKCPPGADTISVISAATAIITASFYSLM